MCKSYLQYVTFNFQATKSPIIMKFGAHVVESLLSQLNFLFVIAWDMFLIYFCKRSLLEVVFYKTILQPSY